MKTCSRCKTSYETVEGNFYSDISTKSGFSYVCAVCKREENRLRHLRLKENKHKYNELPKDKCNQCGEEYPRDKTFWGPLKRSKTGFMPICRKCRNANKRKYYAEKRETKEAREKEKLEREEIRINELYEKILDRKEEKPGLKLKPMKLNPDTYYSIKLPRREGSTKHQYFVGKVIQECERHITLQNKNGIRESFLKVDFLLEHEIKKE